MKIIQLSSENAWRGGEQQIAFLTEELIRHQDEVLVVCKKGSAFEEYCRKKEIPYRALPFRNSMDLASAWKLVRLCKDWKPDLIHAHSSKSYGIAWLAAQLGNKVPMVLSRRVAFTIKNNFINRLKYNHPFLKKIICITEAVRQQVLPLLAAKDKTTVIYSGIDHASFLQHPKKKYLRQNFSLAENAFLIGTTAAFTSEKDYSTFFRTARIVIENFPDKAIIFVAMGEGPEREAMQQFCKTLGIEDKVCFTGFVPEVKNYLHELDIFLFTSRNEGLGSSILDAFASKVPVVSTAVGGVPEIVHHQDTGLLAPIGDAEGLAEQVQMLIEDAELRRKLIANAHQSVQKFDKKITAQQTMEVYKSVLNDVKPIAETNSKKA